MSRPNPFPLDTKRHSGAHVLAAAVLSMFPEAQFGVGPTTDTGFYYDFSLPRTLIPEDLEILEQKMQEIVKADLPIEYSVMPIDEAIKLFTQLKQPLKVELLKDLKEHGTTSFQEIYGDEEEADFHPEIQEVSVYRIGDFVDLCRGPHVERTAQIDMRAIKLDKISAAYFRGDQSRESLQRVYGLQFSDKKELKTFIHNREEAKKRDHRVLGPQMKIFTISELVGSGLVLWQPNGALLRDLLKRYLWQLHQDKGYVQVETPHLAKIDLYKTSGHYEHYKENFQVKGKDEDFMVKPMNCPHHMQIFDDNQFSYRDLPIRYFEPAVVYRDEKSGQLSGLSRVRSITQDDGHLFVREDQIEDEVQVIASIIKEFWQNFDMLEGFWVSLSVRGEDKSEFLGSDEVWTKAESALENAAKVAELPYKRIEGEAAFYGPKLDFMFKDVMNREWQLATIQCDFNLPERFNLSYIDENGEKQRPVVVHRAISGSLERFIGLLIENTAGRFPFWIAPEQVRILPINDSDELMHYVSSIERILQDTVRMEPLKYNEIRYSIDSTGESLGKKIRKASTEKIPVMLIVGPRDLENQSVSIRTQEAEKTLPLAELQDFLMTC